MFITEWFLDNPNVSKDVICLNVKDVESKEEETKMLGTCKPYHFL